MNGCCMGMAMGNAHDDDCWWMSRDALTGRQGCGRIEEEMRPLPPNRRKSRSQKMNKSRAMQQAEATLRAAEATAARAAERIVALSNRPEEPTTDDPDGALVLWFKRTFNGGQEFTYGAVKAGKFWYTTGTRNLSGRTWEDFLDWLDDDLTTPLWQATDGGWVEVQ